MEKSVNCQLIIENRGHERCTKKEMVFLFYKNPKGDVDKTQQFTFRLTRFCKEILSRHTLYIDS